MGRPFSASQHSSHVSSCFVMLLRLRCVSSHYDHEAFLLLIARDILRHAQCLKLTLFHLSEFKSCFNMLHHNVFPKPCPIYIFLITFRVHNVHIIWKNTAIFFMTGMSCFIMLLQKCCITLPVLVKQVCVICQVPDLVTSKKFIKLLFEFCFFW